MLDRDYPKLGGRGAGTSADRRRDLHHGRAFLSVKIGGVCPETFPSLS